MADAKRWYKNLGVAGACLTLFVLIPLVAFLGGRSVGIDPAATAWLHSMETPALTALMEWVTKYAYHTIHWWLLGGVGLYFLLRRRSVSELIILLVVRYGADLAQETIKTWYARPRPALDWVKPSSSFSYPSGTVTVGAAFCLIMAYVIASDLTDRRARWATIGTGWSLAILVAISRIYLGAHWFTDTVGAILLATALVSLATIPLALRAKAKGVETVPLPREEAAPSKQ